MQLHLFINILCTGIIFTGATVLFFMGSQNLSTKFHALFWFYIFTYLIQLTLYQTGIIKFPIADYTHFFIPAFSALSFFVELKKQFKYYFLTPFIIPVIGIIFLQSMFQAILYHLVFWSLVIIINIILIFINTDEEKRFSFNKKRKEMIIGLLLTFFAVFPFILINLFIGIFYSPTLIIESILPPCLALILLLIIFLSYQNSLFTLDYAHYANLDFLKKSSATEKQTIIEKISAGLIHEIKNPVTAIQSLNQQLQKNINTMERSRIRQYSEIFSEELDKIKSLSEHYLTNFRNKTTLPIEEVNLFSLLSSLQELLHFEFQKKNLRLTIDGSIKGLIVPVNSYRIRQVFLNLIYNALDAEATSIIVTAEEDKDYIQIYVEDNGNGIQPDMSDSIFMPFVTNKLDGTGMGLTICREIMHENFGNIILVESSPGKTIFKITIKQNEAAS